MLADGATWHLPRIVPEPDPAATETGRWRVAGRPFDRGWGAEFQASLALTLGLTEALDAPAEMIQTYATARVAAPMLRANYRLDPADATWLACYGFLSEGDFAGLATCSVAFLVVPSK